MQANVYEITSDLIFAVVPENQLLRTYDNVPKNALAQEITGNRLVYANYEQNYNIVNKPILIGDYISRYKNNEYPENTYIRPEYLDGEIIPSGLIRPKEKSLQELRQEKGDFEKCCEILKKYSILNQCKKIANDFVIKAINALNEFSENDYKKALIELANSSLSRDN